MKKTRNVVQVAVVLMEDPHGKHWGYDTGKKASMRSGALYPVLNRMLEEGWLRDGWEDHQAAAAEGRPPRRYYQITELGLARLGALLAEAKTDRRFAGIDLTPGFAS